MPTNLTYPTYYSYRRLSFGVPLEDVFPSGELHPALKNLFVQSYENVAKKTLAVEEVLSCYQGSLHERLALKEKVVLCREIRNFKAAPGALLWVIRHFIGLLPIQLLPRRIGGQKYFWWKITKECKKCLSSYATTGRNDNELLHKLSSEMLRLPSQNFLLFATLLNFLRMLAVLPGGEPRVNKYALFALVKYYSSCVFVRPFRPGCVTKIDKQFYPLMLYLILKWPEVRRICMETSNYSFELPLEEVYPGFAIKSHVPGHPHYVSKQCSDNTTQTTVSKPKSEQEETLIRMVPRSYDDFNFLRDIGCQTDANFFVEFEMQSIHEVNRKRCCCCCLGSHYEKSPRNQWPSNSNSSASIPFKIDNKMTFMRKDCCCSYSANYETNFECPERSPTQKYEATNVKPYGWNIKGDISDNLAKVDYNQDLNNREFTESPDSYYDDCNSCNLVTESESDDYCLIKTFDPIQKKKKQIQNEVLKEDILKMGLFSTPKEDSNLENYVQDDETQHMQPFRSIGWNVPHDYQNLYYELRESLNKELKEKLSTMKLKSVCDGNDVGSDNGENGKSEYEEQQKIISAPKLSVKLEESKRSLISMNKLKYRLDFLRIFKTKKIKPKKSCSYEQVSSFKYEKMGSASSLL